MDAPNDMGGGGGAASALENAAPEGGHEDMHGADGSTTVLGPEMLGGKEFEVGDKIELEIVGKTAKGGVEVKYSTGDEPGGRGMERIRGDFKKHMSAASPNDEQGGGY